MLSEIAVPRMKYHSNEAGIAVEDIPLPQGSLIAAVSTPDDVEVATPGTLLYPGDKAIVVVDSDMVDEVRMVFKTL